MYYLTEKRSELKINSLKLKNFRNYDLLNLEFDGSTNIFYGNNAQGKTNILEAVYRVRNDEVPQRVAKTGI